MYYNSNNINFAKTMRSNMTPEENKLWYLLRAKRFFGYKFKRQVPIGDYIVDFLCPSNKLIIELDGGQHNELENINADIERTNFLIGHGYKVIRFWNNDIRNNIGHMTKIIKAIISNNIYKSCTPTKE